MPPRPIQKHLFLCVSACLLAAVGIAQDTSQPARVTIKPTTDFDQRFYYTSTETQNVWGYRLGVLINDKYKLGIGGYYMNKKTDQVSGYDVLNRNTANAVSVQNTFYLGTVYYEPYLLRRRLWETSLVFETGYGRIAQYTTDKTDNSNSNKSNTAMVPAGAGLSINFKPPALFNLECFRWIGINAMAGYRTTLYRQSRQYNYNGAYWSISGAIFLDRMLDDFHSWRNSRTPHAKPAVISF